MASLEDMVPDVLFLMLLNAPSMQILWGFIRASPRMYGVFRNQRDVILSTVVTREIGHGIMGDAQSALRSSRFNARGLLKQQALEWIAKYRAAMTSNTVSSRASLGPEALPLWRIHQDVKFFAELFVSERLHIVAGGFRIFSVTESTAQRDNGLDGLSNTEKMRIYRAIYRYAIYGNLFYFDEGRPGTVKSDLLYAQEQSHSFLTLFPAWQVEELSCINDFIHDKILEKWQEVEDDFYAFLKDHPHFGDPGREDQYNSRWEDDFFSQSIKADYYEEWQRYFATLTLSELREIFTAKANALLTIVKRHANRFPHDFLTEALDEDPYHVTFITPEYEAHEQALESGIKVQFQEDAIDQPNEGWLWAHRYEPCNLYIESTRDFPTGEGLRRFGYVFWDSDRLHDSGILQKESAYPILHCKSPIVRDMLTCG